MGPYNPNIAAIGGLLPGRGGKLSFLCHRDVPKTLLGHPDASETVLLSVAFPGFAAHYIQTGYQPYSSVVVRPV